jgi:hypothetical protein
MTMHWPICIKHMDPFHLCLMALPIIRDWPYRCQRSRPIRINCSWPTYYLSWPARIFSPWPVRYWHCGPSVLIVAGPHITCPGQPVFSLPGQYAIGIVGQPCQSTCWSIDWPFRLLRSGYSIIYVHNINLIYGPIHSLHIG